MKKMQILVDLDGIVVDLLDNWLRLYNEEWNDSLTHSDITDWYLHKSVVPACGADVYKYLDLPGTFLHSKPIPGAIESLGRLKELGHDITIVSSPATASHTYSQKIEWCTKHLPFLKSADVILAKKKHLIYGDLLIDDFAENLTAYKKSWPNGMTATIAYPYNKSAEGSVDIYAHSYLDFGSAWLEIEKFIVRVSEQD